MTSGTKHDGGAGREWLRRLAEAEERCESVAAGGLAADVGLIEGGVSAEIPRIFGRFIEFARRARGLSVEELAERADVNLAELLAVEEGAKAPSPRTVFQLAKVLRFSTSKLLQLAGLAAPKDASLNRAALRFAARSESTAKLSRAEREAFEEFASVLADAAERG